MIKARVVLQCLLVLTVVGCGATARAADTEPDGWRVTVIPYVWAAGLYGDVTVRGVTAPASTNA